MIRKLQTEIKNPFWSAGQKYGWEGSRTGIGINVKFFEGMHDDDILEVPITLSGKTRRYRISKGKADTILKMYNSYFVARDNTKLLVLPLHEMDEVIDSDGLTA